MLGKEKKQVPTTNRRKEHYAHLESHIDASPRSKKKEIANTPVNFSHSGQFKTPLASRLNTLVRLLHHLLPSHLSDGFRKTLELLVYIPYYLLAHQAIVITYQLQVLAGITPPIYSPNN
ncbi:AIF_HP2_G0052270.mRNA.1.CDS.1 [Saccharomyces cerevisiae]|nr:AIF_HP2_G0052270.mRNA.1.CDS.1 [Saccharomyces cerevisiae]CAI6797202.1 AIF_HP2_G0052270.mRNA.1.CDS.1 [Saccharomyces cerevisiae]